MERLHKFLARAGVASRRACEDLIMAGRVSVNGRVQRELGTQIDPDSDEIKVDDTLIEVPTELHYVLLNKPFGVITSMSDPEGRTTVADLVQTDHRLFPVGRLDFDSEGLLLMTDDGDLTFKLTHPSFEVEKEYRALLDQAPSTEQLRQWRQGVELDDGRTAPAWVETLDMTASGIWVRVVIHEGRNRQVRRVAEQLGLEVKRLLRVREGPLELGDLPTGEWRPLTEQEITALRRHAKRSKGWLPSRPLPESPQDENPQERPRPMLASRPAIQRDRTAERPPRRRDDDRRPRREANERPAQRAALPAERPPRQRDDAGGNRPLRRRADDAGGNRPLRRRDTVAAESPPRHAADERPVQRDTTAAERPPRRRDDDRKPRRDADERPSHRRDDDRKPRRDRSAERPARRDAAKPSQTTDDRPWERSQESARTRRTSDDQPVRRDPAGSNRPLRRRDTPAAEHSFYRDDPAEELPIRRDEAKPSRRTDERSERQAKRSPDSVRDHASAPQPPQPEATVAAPPTPETPPAEPTQPPASTHRQRSADERRRTWQRAASRTNFGRGRGDTTKNRRDSNDES